MALSFADQFTTFDSATFQERLLMCLLKVSQNIISEDPETPDHAERVLLAEKIIRDTVIPFRMNLLLPVLNPALQVAEPSDGDIEFSVITHWGYFSSRL